MTTVIRVRRLRLCMLSAMQTEGNAVNIDTTDCNGGLGKTLAVRLRIVRFSRSPRASKLQCKAHFAGLTAESLIDYVY